MKINTSLFNFVLALCLATVSVSKAQLTVSTTAYNTPSAAQSLVNNILLGAGVTASNITFTPAGGESVQLGFFNGVNSNLGLDSGIVMSTGNIQALSPVGIPAGAPLGGSDPDLLTLANSVPPLIGQTFSVSSTNDVAILEFDFVPAADTVKFRYVFGSDEYTQWINSSYNDVFGFFISGPGITGPFSGNSQNIAVVPGTNPPLPITISSVQPNLNGQYYISNTGQASVSLNGFTTVFTAVSPVICGETYHIRLAIADGSDGTLDSGVFLEALSFTSNAVSLVSNTLNGDTTIVEGCSQAAFTFFRPGSVADTLSLPITVSGTAIEGTDYNALPDTVTFLPGENTVVVPIVPVNDGISEGPESIIISFTQDICGSFLITSSIWIVPVAPVTANAPDTTLICPNTNITLNAQYSGGYPPYTVVWNTGDTANSIIVNIGTTTTYYYTVTDTCYGIPVTDSITVTVPVFTPMQINAPDLCLPAGTNGTLTANVTGGFPPYSYAWTLDGNFVGFSQQLSIFGIQDTVYVVQVGDACGSSFPTDSVFVSIGIPVNLDVITAGINNSIVEGCGTAILDFTRPGAAADTLILPITISGTAIAGSDYNALNDTIVFLPGQNQIQFTVSAVNDGVAEPDESIVISYFQVGCGLNSIVTDSIMIFPLAPIITNAQSTYNITCPGDAVTINSSFIGGYPPYTVVWNTGDTAATITVNPGSTTTYTYTVTDSCSSQPVSQTITVNVPTASPITATTNATQILCPNQASTLTAQASGGFPGYTYAWTLNGAPVGTGSTYTTPNNLTQSTTYVLVVTDACGTAPVQFNVTATVVPYLPITLDLGQDITVPCPNVGTELEPIFSNGRRPYTFTWSAGAVPLGGDSTAIAQPSVTTTYYLTMADACQQSPVTDSITLNVQTYSQLTAVASPDTTVCPGNPITLSVIADGGAGTYSYLWQDLVTLAGFPGNNAVSISPIIDYTVTYNVTVTDLCGNTAIDEVSVPLRTDCDVVVPNIITPNGDGENQFLVFENLELFPQPKLEVFNRWGNRVYQSDNYQNNWSPADLNPGVYYFTLELGTIDPKKGFFQLMK
ncbi:MAG: choice-of-anchor L domain-containing protein [Bacteroidota bacterium]